MTVNAYHGRYLRSVYGEIRASDRWDTPGVSIELQVVAHAGRPSRDRAVVSGRTLTRPRARHVRVSYYYTINTQVIITSIIVVTDVLFSFFFLLLIVGRRRLSI